MSSLSDGARDLLAKVTAHYLDSGDFNGLAVSDETSAELVAELIRAGLVSLNRGDRHPNPHINAFSAEPAEVQLEKIERLGLDGCLYPAPAHLELVVDRGSYDGKPFTLRLALGAPQLSFLPFDLMVLEHYRNDPRYVFNVDDVQGMISVSDKYYESDEMHARDQTLLQTIGFAYDKSWRRAVAVYVRYLSGLTPEHQRIWEARLLEGQFYVHPDYHSMSMGEFPEKVPILLAFTEKLRVINEMSAAMGRPALFRREFRDRERPRDFSFLLRPTLRAFNDFVLTLDKMLSENIDTEFFRSEVSLERDVKRKKDGKTIVERKGSIQVLDEWLTNTVKFPDPGPKDEMIAAFKHIRKLRQQPAHALKEDEFDQKYVTDQLDLIARSYRAIRCLRLILANHPATRTCEVPEWLIEGRVRDF